MLKVFFITKEKVSTLGFEASGLPSKLPIFWAILRPEPLATWLLIKKMCRADTLDDTITYDIDKYCLTTIIITTLKFKELSNYGLYCSRLRKPSL